MYKGKKIGVSVPAYNEEKLIGKVITTMPDFVDLMTIVDDCSKDRTSEVVRMHQAKCGKRLALLRNPVNLGVGGAILAGHEHGYSEGMEILVVMAGDAQMDPVDLPGLLDPILEGRADYVKGNRFLNHEAWRNMPKVRYFGSLALSWMNKVASGYWHLSDPQCGYTAITRQALEKLDVGQIERGYPFENDILIHLNLANQRVSEVPIHAVYGQGERSGIQISAAVFQFFTFLVGRFFWRIWRKYIARNYSSFSSSLPKNDAL